MTKIKKAPKKAPKELDKLDKDLIAFTTENDLSFSSDFEPLDDVKDKFPQKSRRLPAIRLHGNLKSLLHVRHKRSRVEFIYCYKERLVKAKKERILQKLKATFEGFQYVKLLQNGCEKRPEFLPFYSYLPESFKEGKAKRELKALMEKLSAQLLVFVKDPSKPSPSSSSTLPLTPEPSGEEYLEENSQEFLEEDSRRFREEALHEYLEEGPQDSQEDSSWEEEGESSLESPMLTSTLLDPSLSLESDCGSESPASPLSYEDPTFNDLFIGLDPHSSPLEILSHGFLDF